MKEFTIGHLLVLAICALLPLSALAQDEVMSFSEEETAKPAPADEEAKAETEGRVNEVGTKEEAAFLSGLGGEAPVVTDAPTKDVGLKAGPVQTKNPIWAVQQIYALKSGRLDLQPSFGVSMNDPYVQHMAVSLGASYYLTEVLSVGVSFNFYRWLDNETNLNFRLERATHQAVPINEYFWGGQLNFGYVPMYGKFAMFRQWILHWDVWILGGGGFIFTRPIPNIDPDYRIGFDWDMKFCFNLGIGARVFLNRFLGVYVEVRDYIFPEKLEALTASADPVIRADTSTWLQDGYSLTNNVMLHAGVTIFIPFVVKYELPK